MLCRTSMAVVAVAAALLGACSSDAAVEPEPDIHTRGAFIAVRGEAGLSLKRTLDTLVVQGSTLILVTEYAERPESWDEAREMAKRTDLLIEHEVVFLDEVGITQLEHRVVWFRTLTEEEEARIP